MRRRINSKAGMLRRRMQTGPIRFSYMSDENETKPHKQSRSSRRKNSLAR